MQATKAFSPEQFTAALDGWGWLGSTGTPLLATLFGSVIFEHDGGYGFLDVLDGTITHPWADLAELESDLDTAEGQVTYLLLPLAVEAHEAGLALGPDQVYDFVRPPVLGGSLDVGNLQAGDFVVTVDLAGQIAEQIKDLPPGTPITGLSIGGSTGSPKPRRRFGRRNRG